MSYGPNLLSWFVVPAILAVLSGCGPSATPDRAKQAAPSTAPVTKAVEKGAEASPGAAAAGTGTAPSSDIEKALAKLSPEDRAPAEKQKTCPVSGAALGSMDKPFKTTVKDKAGKSHTVFLCCDGCEEQLKKDPDKYLEKIAASR